MSSNYEVKAENLKKGDNDVLTVENNGQLNPSVIPAKSLAQIVNSEAISWSEPFAINSFETDNNNANRATVPYNASFYNQNNNISAFTWVKLNTTSPGNSNIFSHGETGDLKWFVQEQSGVLRVLLSSDGTTVGKDYRSTVSINDNEWHHIGFTFSSDTLKLYLDGVNLTGGSLNQVTNNTVSTLNVSISDLGLNCVNSTGFERPVNGLTHGLTYWDKQLSDAEVTELYNAGKSYQARNHSANANLISFWAVNNDTISSGKIRDVVNAQDADIIGSPTISLDVPPSDGTLTFSEDLQVLYNGLGLSVNNIPTSESPLTFEKSGNIAYFIPNTTGPGGNVTLSVDEPQNVPNNAIGFAYRDNNFIVLGSNKRLPVLSTGFNYTADLPTINYDVSPSTGLTGSYVEWKVDGNIVTLNVGAHYSTPASNNFFYFDMETIPGLPLPKVRSGSFIASWTGAGGVGNGGSVLNTAAVSVYTTGSNYRIYLLRPTATSFGEWHLTVTYEKQ